MDSGANEHMFKTQSVFTHITDKKSSILTACTSGENNFASVGNTKKIFFEDGKNLAVEQNSPGVFSEHLMENLVSLGKICDTGNHTVIFDKKGYVIFQGEVTARGKEVGAQDRDPQTGLYPITLTTDATRGCRAGCPPATREGDGSLVHKFSDIKELRAACALFSAWAENTCKHKEKIYTESEIERDILKGTQKYFSNLARFYVKEGTSEIERWHNKLGHVGTKILKLCLENLKIPSAPFRCEHCIRGKMHVGEHSTKSTGKISDLKPGEYIITDLQGPYVRSRNQEKYSQIFLDVISKRVWVVRLKKKSESDNAIEKVLLDAKTRSRKEVRIVRTDGDGIFGRSKSFQELKEKEKFLHERPAPYDHRQNARIDRECRTLLEGVNTALDQSGAPSNFWGDAADHFILQETCYLE